MDFSSANRLILGTLLLLVSAEIYAEDQYESYCGGPNALLALINRPSVIESVCTVPHTNAILEMGTSYQALTDGGNQLNLPQPVYRYGLADHFEVDVIIPNYIHQTVDPRAGFTTTALAVKHVIGVTKEWIASLEGIAILPAGSAAFGTTSPGGAFNAIISHNFTEEISTTVMFSVSSQSESRLAGGQSYVSFNPIALLSWSKEKVSLYAEVFGQTRVSSDEGAGFNMDAGIIYLLQKNITIDFSVGQRLTGPLGNYNHYVGTGMCIQFG